MGEKEFKATKRLLYLNFCVSFSSSNPLRVSCQISLWSDAGCIMQLQILVVLFIFMNVEKSYLKMSKRANHKRKKKITTHISYVCVQTRTGSDKLLWTMSFLADSIGWFSISNCIGAGWRFASKIFIVHILWALNKLFSINEIKSDEDDYDLCVLYGLNGLICVISEEFALKTLQIKLNVL